MGTPLSVRALRGGFRVFGKAAPGLAAVAAARLFGMPPRRRTSDAESSALALSLPQLLRLEARASSGRTSSLPQFALAIRAVADAAGGIEAAVAHSLGCASVAFAMTRGLSLSRAVFVAPAANPGAYTEKFARTLAIPPPVLERMKRSFEEKYHLTWDELDVPRAARSFRAGLLVIHDRDDAEVPFENGEAIASAWPGATLVATEGLGHTRIVHDDAVVARAVAFVTGSESPNQPL